MGDLTMRVVKTPKVDIESITGVRTQLFKNLRTLPKGQFLEIAGLTDKRLAYMRGQVSQFNRENGTGISFRKVGDGTAYLFHNPDHKPRTRKTKKS